MRKPQSFECHFIRLPSFARTVLLNYLQCILLIVNLKNIYSIVLLFTVNSLPRRSEELLSCCGWRHQADTHDIDYVFALFRDVEVGQRDRDEDRWGRAGGKAELWVATHRGSWLTVRPCMAALMTGSTLLQHDKEITEEAQLASHANTAPCWKTCSTAADKGWAGKQEEKKNYLSYDNHHKKKNKCFVVSLELIRGPLLWWTFANISTLLAFVCMRLSSCHPAFLSLMDRLKFLWSWGENNITILVFAYGGEEITPVTFKSKV